MPYRVKAKQQCSSHMELILDSIFDNLLYGETKNIIKLEQFNGIDLMFYIKFHTSK